MANHRKELDEYENNKVTEILENVSDTYIKEGLSDGKKNEGKNNLLKYGPKIYEFIRSHGEIDASQNGESTAVTSNLRLSNEYKQVHSLDNKMLEAINQNVQKSEKAHKQKTEKEDGKSEDVNKRKG